MEDQYSLHQRTQNRQIYVQRKNLVQICRFAVKSLIDKASLATVDDECEEVINFCAVLERLLSHRLKAQKTWFTIDEDQCSFWGYVKVACKKVPNNCINSIANLENVKSPLAKGRAWIRCVLMEKRLSEYLNVALQQTGLTRKFYKEGAVMLTEDANMLNGVLLGLNAIDFSFCLKGNNVGLSSQVEIDFTPYLRFQQSQESLHSDAEELQELSTISSMTSSIMSEDITIIGDDSWQNKYKALEAKYKTVNEQKGYLEELGRARDHQLYQLQHQRQTLLNTVHQFDVEGKKERHQLELIILELQKQLATMKKQCEVQQQKYNSLMRKLQAGQVDMDDVNVINSPPSPGSSVSNSHRSSYSSNDAGAVLPVSAARLAIPGTAPAKFPGQNLGVEANVHKEETQSMIAMAGSFTSQASLQSSENIPNQPVVTHERMQARLISAEKRGSASEINTPEKKPSKPEIIAGHVDDNLGIKITESRGDNSDIMVLDHQNDVFLTTKEEDFVIVPEQAQEASSFISDINTESGQSGDRLQTDTKIDQSEDTLQSREDLIDNGNLAVTANQYLESQDIANQNVPSDVLEGNQIDRDNEEKDPEKDETSTGSDDIMVLSDVSLSDTADTDISVDKGQDSSVHDEH